MVNAQEYINQNYPTKEEREKVKALDIYEKNLEGELELFDFVNLEKLDCFGNKLTNLNVSCCSQLTSLYCDDNLLINIVLPQETTKLQMLDLRSNNFLCQDLSFLIPYTNLKRLELGNWDEGKLKKSICNKFSGSGEYLRNMNQLKEVDMNNTDIDAKFEHLPANLEEIYCSSGEKPTSKVKGLEEQLKKSPFFDYQYGRYTRNWKDIITEEFNQTITENWKKRGFNRQQTKSWIKAGLQPNDYEFATYLRWKDHDFYPDLNYVVSKIEFANWLQSNKSAQDYLDCSYPWEERWRIRELDLSNLNLVDDLNLIGFTSLRKVTINGNHQLGEIKNKKWKTKIVVKAQEWVNREYPNKKKAKKIELYYDEKITGELVITDYLNLQKIRVSEKRNKSEITKLTIRNCPQLTELNCSYSQLINLETANCPNLINLYCSCSKLTNLALSNYSNLTDLDCSANQLTKLEVGNCLNLKKLNCSYNQLTELSLTNLVNLKELSFSNNQLVDLDFLNDLDPKQLTKLEVCDNKLPEQDLSVFSKLVNLEELLIGNCNKKKIDQNIYNHWIGSLEPLKNCTKLERLDISNTDLNSGVEYLPCSIFLPLTFIDGAYRISYSTTDRPASKLKEIAWQLDLFASQTQKYWEKLGFTLVEVKEWLEAGLKVSEYDLVDYLCKEKNLGPSEIENNLSELREEYNISTWKSKHKVGDQLIQKYQLNKLTDLWIPYEEFSDVEYLTHGGFSKIYKTKRNGKGIEYVLKSLNNSQSIADEFLQEITNYKLCVGNNIIPWLGISRDPVTNNYLIVMEYMKGGNLRQHLQGKTGNLLFGSVLFWLHDIATGLNIIHREGLIHQDLHSGNILSDYNDCYIADLGLSRPANETDSSKIYGVLPYVAPEVLCGKGYSQASDIYSFGIVAYELLSGLPPYHDLAHDKHLLKQICQGLRPNLADVKVPQLLKDLINRCWDVNPLVRPTASKLEVILANWCEDINEKKVTEFSQQYQEKEWLLNNSAAFDYKTHPQAIYTSRLLDFTQNSQQTEESSSQLTKINEQKKTIEEEIKLLKDPLDSGLAELVENFIQARKKMIKNKEDKQVRKRAGELEEKLEEKGLSEEEIDKVIRCCKRLVDLEQQLEKEQLQVKIEIPTKK